MITCPNCGNDRKRHGQYLCPPCWFQLPKATQRALYRRDDDALRRLGELHDAIDADIPLSEVVIR